MKFLIGCFLLILSLSSHALVVIYDTKNDRSLTEEAFLSSLPDSGHFVLGEKHYTPLIQEYQGKLISKIVRFKEREKKFAVAWEFLDYPNQKFIDTHVSLYNAGVLSADTLLKKLFKGSRNPLQNRPYLHSFRAAKELGGKILGANAPRAWKREITAGGVASINPEKVPANYKIGSDNYFERFEIAMGGHVGGDKLKKYFEAQSYTDSVMAWVLSESKFDFNFLLVGEFHSDYNDGVVLQLKDMGEAVVSIKIIDAREMSVNGMRMIMAGHELYGLFADYLYFVRD